MTRELPGYQINQKIYEGDRTLVYQATRHRDRLKVVIKFLRNPYPSLSELLQFRNQYAIAKNLNPTHIVVPLSLERYGNGYALVMEDEGAISLDKVLDQKGYLELETSLQIAIQLADIVDELERKGVIHKDIKPANLLIDQQSQKVKLIDFSIASPLPREAQDIKNFNVLEGTLAYIAPEQTGRMNRGIDYRSDFYSLGVTLYQLLTGTLPFISDDPMELVHCHISQPPIPPEARNSVSKIPPVVSDIVMKLMAKNAEQRYQSALGLKFDLEQALKQWQETGKIEAFELGSRDISGRFLIPEKLYGRQAEVETLLGAFERVAQSSTTAKFPGNSCSSELMLVAGFSGIGKTAVVNEVHKPIVRERGYFIKGKFDQFQRNIPFSALVRAFRDLMEQLFGESDAQLAQWQQKILGALGENGQVIIEVIPELELIIGQQKTVPELSGGAAQNRFNLLFQKFVEVFATSEHPLVIFIDDLQWADSASLKLMQLLMSESQTGYLLLLGAYRDNEVSSTHPLMLTLDEMGKSGAVINTITLAPLRENDLHSLVTDTLSCSQEVAQPLTALIYQKTKGNPFFATQFLKGLHEDGLIAFNHDLGYWHCDLTQVQQLALTDDVVEFMAVRLLQLPVATQEMLKLAACIGNQFDLETLAIVSKLDEIEVADSLWKALQEGLILPLGQTYKFFQGSKGEDKTLESDLSVSYKFLHDRVQQAAYSLIPEVQKQVTHYRIGKRLLAHVSPAQQEEKIFDIVNQINMGLEEIAEVREKQQLLELNFRAGQKAKIATAYDAAKLYFQIAIALLPDCSDNTEENISDRTFELHFVLAEVQLMSVDFEGLETSIALLLALARSAINRARIYVLKVNQYALQGAYPEAIEAGLAGLQELEIQVHPEHAKELVQEDTQFIAERLENQDLDELLNLPEATDPEVKVAIELLMKLLSAAYISSNRELYGFTVVRSVRLSMEYGNIPKSIITYASYGEWLALFQHDYQRAMQFAQLALQLSYKLDQKSERSSACFILGGCIYGKAKPIQGAAEVNYEGFLAGMESGELQYAGYNLFANIYNRLFGGENLVEISTDLEKFWAIADKIHNDLTLRILEACRFSIEKFSGGTDKESSEELAWVERHSTAQSDLPLGLYSILQMQAACLYGDFESGCHYGVQASKFLMVCDSCTIALGYYYYGSLNLLGRDADLSEDARQQIEANQAQLNTLAQSCPENFLHKYWLVEAEKARLSRQRTEAMELYDRAIAGAKENEFLQEEALANELAAKFYLDWGKEKIAGAYIIDAYYCYARWGAKAKTDQLERTYPQLLAPMLQQPYLQLNNDLTRTSTIAQTAGSSSSKSDFLLDWATAVKASQSLSSEMDLDKLVSALMRATMENAGADGGILLLRQPESWQIAARYSNKNGQDDWDLCWKEVSEELEIPMRIINKVKRSKEAIIVNNFSGNLQFAGDPYLEQEQPLSFLCAPILNQGKLIGILYLENHLATRAFTSDRVELLSMLCSQAAISLENARLYKQSQDYAEQSQDYAQKLEQSLEELQQAQLQLVQSEKMSALGNLVAGVAHEINNPVAFIAGNIDPARDYLKDLFGLLDLYQQEYPQPSEVIEEEIEAIDLEFLREDLPQLIASMQEGTDRIGHISTSLRTFSRTDKEYTVPFNLHEGIDSTLLILKHRLKANDERPAIKIVKKYRELPKVKCFPGQLNQVFMNLIANAIDALEESNQGRSFEEIANQIKITTSAAKEDAIVQIADNGTGMPEEVRERIFEQGFTTKAVGKGTGLGMAIARQIVEEKHGGIMTCDSELGKGTTFEIVLPISSS